MQFNQHTALIIASENELRDSASVWGTGGWLPPEERTALDWFTLCRTMGLKVSAIEPLEFSLDIFLSESIKWIIIACDPNSLPHKFIEQLTSALESHTVSVITPVGEVNSPLAKWSGTGRGRNSKSGKSIYAEFLGTQKKLRCRGDLECYEIQQMDTVETIAFLEDLPIITRSRKGIGKLIVLAFDPGRWRDREGIATFLLQRLLLFTSDEPVAWLNWQNTLILRMDDPGSAETVYNECYKKNKLRKEEWGKIGEELSKRNGRLSLGYVTGWVDDGDDSRGKLFLDGEPVNRKPGKIYPSPLVKYRVIGNTENKTFDYKEEFEAIQELRKKKLVEVEMHGFTHISPDRKAWLHAPDRYTNNAWYREFGPNAIQYLKENPPDVHPFDSALQTFQLFFDRKPTTLICPGDVFTDATLKDALNKGLMLVGSYYLAIRDHNRFCWSQHICAPYLDKPEKKWFDSGLPVVGYFHDFDIVEKGIGWFADCLEGWKDAGATKLIDFYELNAALNVYLEINSDKEETTLIIRTHPDFPLPRPLEIFLFFPDKNIPDHIKADINETSSLLDVIALEDNMGMILLRT